MRSAPSCPSRTRSQARWLAPLLLALFGLTLSSHQAPASSPGQLGASNRGRGVESATVTTDGALALQAALPASAAKPGVRPRRGFPAGFADLKAAANADAAPVSSSGVGTVQADPAGGAVQAAVKAGANFPAIQDNSTFIPPDPTIAVGKKHVLQAVNSRFTIFDRAGNNLLAPPGFITSNVFFSGLPNVSALTIFDPWCVYDVKWKRFIMLWVARNVGTQTGYYVLAISPKNRATGTWLVYSLNATLDGAAPSNPRQWADYPRLGYDKKRLYITSNQFDFSPSFRTSKIRSISKKDLLNGGGLSWVDYINLQDSGGGTAFTIEPCQQAYPKGKFTKKRMWFINTVFGTDNRINVRSMDSKTGALSGATAVTVGGYSIPPDAEQMGDARRINTNDNRCLNAVLANGRIVGTHCTSVNFGGGATESAIQWYEINVVTGVPALVQSGTFGATNLYYYFPSIAPTRKGGMGISFSRSGVTEFASARRTGRSPGDALGFLQGSISMTNGVASYFKDFGSGRNRWGDYNGSSIDPKSKDQVWLCAEYAAALNTWGTVIEQAQY